MAAVGSRVGHRVGQRVGVTLGRAAGGGIASFLPTIVGTFPTWHQADLADGAVTTWTDLSLGKALTGTATKGSGKVTFNGTTNVLSTSDATVTGYASSQQAVALMVIAELKATPPAASEMLGAWGNTGSNYYFQAFQLTSDKLRLATRAGLSAELSADTVASMDSTRRAYIFQRTAGATPTISTYVDNTLDGTATGALDSNTTNRFALGALMRSTASFFSTASIITAVAMSRVPTATERTQFQNYLAAGAPR